MEFFKNLINNPPDADLQLQQSVCDTSEDDTEGLDVDEIESSQKSVDDKMMTEDENSKMEKSLSQDGPLETPRNAKKRKISETGGLEDGGKIEGLTDRAVLEKIYMAVEGGEKKANKRFKSHAQTLNTLKVNDEILNVDIQALKHETARMNKFFTNKLHQMNRDVNSMKFEESNVIIYDLKVSELQALIKHGNEGAAVQKFGLNFIRRYINDFKHEDFKATKLQQEGEADGGGDKWRMMLRLASTHFAQLLMWRMKQRKHWNFRPGMSKLSRDQNTLIEEEVKRKNAQLDKNSDEMFKRKFGNKIAVVKRSDPHKTVRFVEPFDPKPYAKSKLEMGTRLVEHEADDVEESEAEEGSDGENDDENEQSSVLIEDTLNLDDTAKSGDASKNVKDKQTPTSATKAKKLSRNGIPLGRPPGTKTNDASKIKKSSAQTSSASSKSGLKMGTLTSFNSNATRKDLRGGLSERDNLIAQQKAENEELTRELEKLRAEKLARSGSVDDSKTA